MFPTTRNGASPGRMGRRRFLNRLASLLAVVTAGNRVPFADEVAPHRNMTAEYLQSSLSRFAYRLFPHEGVAAAVYDDVARALLQESSEDPALAELLAEGARELDGGGDTPWLERGAGEQIDAMIRIEDSTFFRFLRRTTIEHIYRDPRVWQRIGYEGSSVEKGGYLERGFDDIDWLPPVDEGR